MPCAVLPSDILYEHYTVALLFSNETTAQLDGNIVIFMIFIQKSNGTKRGSVKRKRGGGRAGTE